MIISRERCAYILPAGAAILFYCIIGRVEITILLRSILLRLSRHVVNVPPLRRRRRHCRRAARDAPRANFARPSAGLYRHGRADADLFTCRRDFASLLPRWLYTVPFDFLRAGRRGLFLHDVSRGRDFAVKERDRPLAPDDIRMPL